MPTCVTCKQDVDEVFVFHDDTRMCAPCIKAGRIDEAVDATEPDPAESVEAT